MGDVRIIDRPGRDLLGEGLLWSDRAQAVYWVDILGKQVHRLSLADDSVASWALPDRIGWLIERRDQPGFVAGLGREIVVLTLDPLTITPVAAPEPERDGNRMNDAKADRDGRIWFGTMPISGKGATGAFYRLEANARASRVDDGYTIANGPAIGDGYLYHTDTALDTIYRYPVNDDGSLGGRSVFVTFERGWGHPDGMTLDAEGGLWVASWGASCVARFDVAGRRERAIALPASQITNVTFAGDGLDRMFVTSASDGVADREPHAGALFEVDPGCAGLPTLRYAG